jgi:hypothetical protein
MKIANYFVAFLIPFAYLTAEDQTTTTTAAVTTEPEIHYSLKEDGRNWKVGNESANEQMKIVQYVPENESIDNWNELMTLHYVKDIQIDPKKYFELFIDQLKKIAPQSKISSHIIKETPTSLFGEWWIQEKSENDQHEWIQIFADGHNLAIIRYTTKNVDDIEKNRKKWEDIIGSSTYP